MNSRGARTTPGKELFPKVSNASSPSSPQSKDKKPKDIDADLLSKAMKDKRPLLDQLRQCRTAAEQHRKGYVQECADLVAALAEAEAAAVKDAEEKAELRTKCAKYRQALLTIKEARASNETLTSELKASQDRAGELETKIVNTRAELESCREDLKSKSEECCAISAEVDRLKGAHTFELGQQHEANVKATDEFNSLLEQARADIETLTLAQTASLKEKARLQQVVDVAQMAHQQMVNQMTEEYDRVAGEKSDLANDISKLECRLIDAESVTLKWQQEVLKLRAWVDTAVDEMALAKTANGQLRAQLHDCRLELLHVEDKLLEAEKFCRTARAPVNRLLDLQHDVPGLTFTPPPSSSLPLPSPSSSPLSPPVQPPLDVHHEESSSVIASSGDATDPGDRTSPTSPRADCSSVVDTHGPSSPVRPAEGGAPDQDNEDTLSEEGELHATTGALSTPIDNEAQQTTQDISRKHDRSWGDEAERSPKQQRYCDTYVPPHRR